MKYYKITKLQADSIGEFEGGGVLFSPYVREQNDGTFLVAEDMVATLSETEQFKKILWDELPTTYIPTDKITVESLRHGQNS